MNKSGINSPAYAQALMRINFLSRKEIAELPKLLLADEKILSVISGFYIAGTAILCVTSKRIVLIDKKIIRLMIEDLRYEFITEVSYGQQAFMATINLYAGGRQLQFKTWYRNELRMLSQLVQQKMYDVQRVQEQPQDDEKNQNHNQKLQGYTTNPNFEEYLDQRVARWRKATRFVDRLTTSQKTGKQVLKLESPKT